MTTVRGLILRHLRASGPASFSSIAWYLDEQHVGPASDYDPHKLAAEITSLIRAGKVRLYDTGDAYDACDDPPALLEALQGFMENVEAVGIETAAIVWGDMAISYRQGLRAIADLEG